MDEIYELEIEFASLDSNGDNYKTIGISLEEYEACYSDELVHLQQHYDEDTIAQHIYPIKREYLLECFGLDLEESLESDMQEIIDELDKAVEEYSEEHSHSLFEDYDDYDSSDDDDLHEYDDFDE